MKVKTLEYLKLIAIINILICCLCIALFPQTVLNVISNGYYIFNNGKYLGSIEEGQKINHEFVFWNLSFDTIKIGLIEPGCSCSLASVSCYEIHPFRKSVVKLQIDTHLIGQGQTIKGLRLKLEDGRVNNLFVSFTVMSKSNK